MRLVFSPMAACCPTSLLCSQIYGHPAWAKENISVDLLCPCHYQLFFLHHRNNLQFHKRIHYTPHIHGGGLQMALMCPFIKWLTFRNTDRSRADPHDGNLLFCEKFPNEWLQTELNYERTTVLFVGLCTMCASN